jgi:hypothetical protein
VICISDSKTNDLAAPNQLSGPSALTLQMVCAVASWICLLSLVPGAIAVVAHAPVTLMIVVAWAMLVSFVAMLGTLGAWVLVIWREVRVGYTTLQNQFRHLPQLDPRSGCILREAGAPYLPLRQKGAR